MCALANNNFLLCYTGERYLGLAARAFMFSAFGENGSMV